jgi:hypothetical protein
MPSCSAPQRASVGPAEIESPALADVIEVAARKYVRRAGRKLISSADVLPDVATPQLRACLHRFVEALGGLFETVARRGRGLLISANFTPTSLKVTNG